MFGSLCPAFLFGRDPCPDSFLNFLAFDAIRRDTLNSLFSFARGQCDGSVVIIGIFPDQVDCWDTADFMSSMYNVSKSLSSTPLFLLFVILLSASLNVYMSLRESCEKRFFLINGSSDWQKTLLTFLIFSAASKLSHWNVESFFSSCSGSSAGSISSTTLSFGVFCSGRQTVNFGLSFFS